jgi:hypothetical protein
MKYILKIKYVILLCNLRVWYGPNSYVFLKITENMKKCEYDLPLFHIQQTFAQTNSHLLE